MQLCRFRSPIEGRDPHQNVLDAPLCVLHEDIEVAVVIETPSVKEFVLHSRSWSGPCWLPRGHGRDRLAYPGNRREAELSSQCFCQKSKKTKDPHHWRLYHPVRRVFYEDILEGIHDAVLQTDYELIVCPESRLVRKILTQQQVDGAIVFDSKIESNLLVKLASKKFPIVVLDRNLEADYLFPLLIDNQKGVREAFYHLYNQGAQRGSSLFQAHLDSFDNTERMKAFLYEA